MCCVSPVTYQLSLMPTATVTDPPLANSPTMHIRLVHKEPKPSFKKPFSFGILAIHSLTRSFQSTGNRGFKEGTDRQKYSPPTWPLSGHVGGEYF